MKQLLWLIPLLCSLAWGQGGVISGNGKISGSGVIGGRATATSPAFVKYTFAEWSGVSKTLLDNNANNADKVSYGSNLGSTHLLVCGSDFSNTASTALSMTDGLSLTYTQASGSPYVGNDLLGFFTAPTSGGGADGTLQLSWTTGATYSTMACLEYSGAATSSPTDGTCTASASAVTTWSCNVTTSFTNDTIVTVCSNSVAGSAMLAGTGETGRAGGTISGGGNGFLVEEMTTTTAGVYTTNCKSSGSGNATLFSVAIKHP